MGVTLSWQGAKQPAKFTERDDNGMASAGEQ